MNFGWSSVNHYNISVTGTTGQDANPVPALNPYMEMAQDALAQSLVNTTTIHYTYNDADNIIVTEALASKVYSPANRIFVHESGDDFTGVRGEANKPFKTLSAAYAVAEYGDTIDVGIGLYSGYGYGANGVNLIFRDGAIYSVTSDDESNVGFDLGKGSFFVDGSLRVEWQGPGKVFGFSEASGSIADITIKHADLSESAILFSLPINVGGEMELRFQCESYTADSDSYPIWVEQGTSLKSLDVIFGSGTGGTIRLGPESWSDHCYFEANGDIASDFHIDGVYTSFPIQFKSKFVGVWHATDPGDNGIAQDFYLRRGKVTIGLLDVPSPRYNVRFYGEDYEIFLDEQDKMQSEFKFYATQRIKNEYLNVGTSVTVRITAPIAEFYGYHPAAGQQVNMLNGSVLDMSGVSLLDDLAGADPFCYFDVSGSDLQPLIIFGNTVALTAFNTGFLKGNNVKGILKILGSFYILSSRIQSDLENDVDFPGPGTLIVENF